MDTVVDIVIGTDLSMHITQVIMHVNDFIMQLILYSTIIMLCILVVFKLNNRSVVQNANII
jgi:hypothetical protein